jgi:hypothetical protein
MRRGSDEHGSSDHRPTRTELDPEERRIAPARVVSKTGGGGREERAAIPALIRHRSRCALLQSSHVGSGESAGAGDA